jgi:spermidine dehydrogenase
VVGGGISGLAAAFFYRKQAGAGARILVLDNHDDFGGHAKRNEFRHDGRLLIGYGGTQSIDGPAGYSAEAAGLLRDVGIDVQRFLHGVRPGLYSSLSLTRGVFFDKETFGADALVAGAGTLPWPEFLAKAPLSQQARRDVARVYDESVDYLPGLAAEQKKSKLDRMSYLAYLSEVVKVHADALPFFANLGTEFWAFGADAVSALEYWRYGYPGFAGLGPRRSRARGAVHLPFSRRQRLGGAAARARAGASGAARLDDGGRRHGQARLRAARRRRRARPHPPQQHRRERPARRRAGPGCGRQLRARRQALQGPGP